MNQIPWGHGRWVVAGEKAVRQKAPAIESGGASWLGAELFSWALAVSWATRFGGAYFAAAAGVGASRNGIPSVPAVFEPRS